MRLTKTPRALEDEARGVFVCGTRAGGFGELAGHLAFTLHMPRWIALLTLLCLPVFAPDDAPASARVRAPDDREISKELRRAEAVLSKLRRLEAAAAESEVSGDAGGFRKAARKLYPGLFESVSGLRDGDVKTDLSTAAALYESALRAGGGGRADCAREVREAYARLCVETGGDRARLLRAKARLHAGWAEATLSHARGAGVAPDSLSLIRAERDAERALAEEALFELKELAAGLGDGRLEESASETLPRKLEQLDRLLSSLPRDRPARLLREARDAFRDGLYWRLSGAPARTLVVNVNSLDAAPPGALPRLGLRADDADSAARANLRAALRFVDKAEAALRR